MINVEITDTFGGEANYCWVNRMTIINEKDSMRWVLKQIRKHFGITCKLRKAWNDGTTMRYDFDKQHICMFITFDY